ncbi:MAG: DUF1566 domain-containing protein [Nitrospinae bacterium]|nr:DUF1566 domain-containing protein [Nitrospinota bacterium]
MRIVLLTLVIFFSQAVPSFAKCTLKDICAMLQKMDHFSILNACPGSAPKLKECKKVSSVAIEKLPAPEFVDNGDETITDTVNKLRWYKKGVDKRFTLKDAYIFAEGESFAGSSEWRLPTLPELQTLLYPERIVNASGKKSWINPIFDHSKAHYYWTTTTCAEVSFIEEIYQGKQQKKTCQKGDAAVWLILFKVGSTLWFLTKEAKHHVWLVQNIQ